MSMLSKSPLNWPALALGISYVLVKGLLLAGVWWMAIAPFSPALAGLAPTMPLFFLVTCWLPAYSIGAIALLKCPVRKPILEE